MSKRSIRGESSSTAHKRRGTVPRDEDPLPSASASASLARQVSSSSIPKIPLDLIADLILPFVADRATWNNVCCASKDLCLAGKKMTPPWPVKAFNNLGNAVPRCFFSLRITAVVCHPNMPMGRSCVGSMGEGNPPSGSHPMHALP
jgi:hypothetical protein